MTKKICLLGGVAVGKTSLTRRFVQGIFSDRYLTTVGVRIDKKTVTVGGSEVRLILWDLAGEDEFAQLQTTYLKGASACVFVVDGTRASTIETALQLRQKAEAAIGSVPCLVAINKSDLNDRWEVADEGLDALRAAAGDVTLTSAKTGHGVEALFENLAKLVVRS